VANAEFVGLRLVALYMCCAVVFLTLGLAGAHHHPAIWHAGDNTAEQKEMKMDWGIYQLLAVGYRPTVDESLFFSSISFGRHALHHMFPTVDLHYLPFFMPIFEKTCREYGIIDLFPLPRDQASEWSKRRILSVWEGWYGMVLQVKQCLIRMSF
jgi:fatty acid desaturase